ncbi:MAG TPA: PKD domain-containing protein, partial [Puia sp.]|nr:PKD domain-containing protein [Puia sp.]
MNKALLSGLVLLLSLSALGQAPSPKITPNTPTAGCAPLVVQLTDGSTGGTSRSWDFGGIPPTVTPATSTAATQVIVYTQPGTYTVTLTATNANGSANTTTTITVFPAPAADFTPSITAGCFPTSVSFTDNSTPGNLPGASLTYWLWDFGDGTLDSVQNPTHLYKRSGNFKVTLYVKNNFGCKGNASVKTVDGAINLTNGIVSSFTDSLDANCSVPKNAKFTNQTTGPGTLSYTWDFGDGSAKSNAPSPVHTYTAPNDYNVKLITTSNQGCFDTLIEKVTIKSNNNITSFIAPAGVCLNVPITFNNTSNPFPGSSVWDFGDGSAKQTAFNGVHAFTTAGTYKVILTNDFQGCTGADTIAVQAVSQPTVQFTGDKLVGCQAPLTINFKDQTIGATSWLWDFGDGSAQSTTQNPQHTYANFGNYTVTLVAASMGGCSSNHTDVIKIVKPVINITSLPGNGCAPFAFTPTANVVTADGVASYHWDFGNGSTFDGANPPVQNYPNTGTYTVSLHIVTNGGCTADASGLVKVGTNKPTPDFTASPTTLCVGQPVSFQDKTTGTVNGYLWDFGDGQVVHDVQNPTHTYTAPGTYTVKMFAYDDGCGLTTPKTMDIVVKGTAGGFNYSFNCSSKTVYTFTDASTPTPDSWLWDFGDGSTSTSQNPPAHSYTAAGPTNFTVTLTATKDGCPSTISKPISVNQSTTITVNPAPPVCSNTQVLITAHVPGYVASYYYDFGDGNQSGVVNGPLYHTYLNPNSAATPFYNIVVHTTDSLGCTDASAPFQMKVSGVKASFTYSNPKYCSTSATDNLTVNFKDNSVVSPGSTIVSYDWDFGDGNKASGPSVSHTYTVENQYSVKLKVTTSDGCVDSIVYGGLVILARPTAMYTTTGVNFCQTSNIKFTNTSTSRFNPTYTWNFGDGSSYIGADPPPHVYPANGDYTVSLHVADTTGCSSDFTNPLGPIHIDMPSASFTVDQDYSTCPPLTVHFTFTGHYAQSFLWNFDDGGANSVDTPAGHIYAMPGSFNPILTVTSPGGCTASAPAHPIKIDGPIGSMSFSPTGACDNLLVNFTVNTSNDVKFVWFFGDSTTIKPDTTLVPTNSHQYTYPGTFTPVVVLIDNAECAVPYFGSPVTDVTVESIGATNFVADKTLLCDSGTVVFKDTSLLSKGTVINTYVWDFG